MRGDNQGEIGRSDRLARNLLASAAILLALGLASPATAAQSCDALSQVVIPHGKVTSVTFIPAGAQTAPAANLPDFCRVQATLTPSADSDIKIEVWLPASGWNGKFVGIGNGIWAGSISISEMSGPLRRGFAVSATDTGHVGNGLTADFAVGHPEKLVDFGHRAVHEMTVAAKQIVTAFYGNAPKLSYWNSCSTGGRQGLMEAYRYPDDYDAISAMAPANPMTGLMSQTLWTGFQPLRKPGAGLTREKLTALHKSYIAQCDALDGLADGIVTEPGKCRFDPKVAQCKASDGPDCLTEDQVRTMRAIYDGVRDSRTGKINFPGFPPGSEIQLAALISGPEPFPVATSYMRQLVFADPKWDFRTFDYGGDLDKAERFGSATLDVPATGLRRFFARGGKLLLSHGWADGLIPASNTINFHKALAANLNPAEAKGQLRLFMAPGMDHCSGGDGFSAFDTLGVIDAWATSGTPPETIAASRAHGLPPMSRALCAFPKVARYKGAGDKAVAASFTCTAR